MRWIPELSAARLQGEYFAWSAGATGPIIQTRSRFIRPIFTINGLSAALEDLDYQSAARYVKALQEEGVLRETTGQARNRIYHASEVLDAIVGPLSGEEAESVV